MADRAAKDALFEALASVAKALGNGHRAEIIDVLAQGERSVDDLSDEIGQSVANTSHHLRSLARAGVLTTRRDGTRVFYRLTSERVALYRQTNTRFRQLLAPPSFRKSPEYPELKWWREVSMSNSDGRPHAG